MLRRLHGQERESIDDTSWDSCSFSLLEQRSEAILGVVCALKSLRTRICALLLTNHDDEDWIEHLMPDRMMLRAREDNVQYP
jgi:hypothetical protein